MTRTHAHRSTNNPTSTPSNTPGRSAAERPSRAQLLAGLPQLAAAIAQDAVRRERERELPFEALQLFRSSGLGALRIPLSHGGPGGSVEDLIEVLATLAAADSNVAHVLRLHYNFTEALALSPVPASDDAAARLQLDRVLSGAIFGGASSELGTSRPGEITTQLQRDGDGWRLSGRKFYATGTAFSDYANLNVLDDAGAFVVASVPVTRPGLQVLDDWDGMGQRLTASGSLLFDQLRIEANEVTPRIYGTLIGRHTGALRQLHLVAVAAGIVRTLVAEVSAYVQNKGRPAGHSPAATAREDWFVQQTIGSLTAASYAIDVLVADNAAVLQRSAQAIAAQAEDAESQVLQGALATAKTQLVVSQLALQAAERLFEAGGASATARSLNFDRHWRNLRTLFSHNPLAHKARVVGDYHLNGNTTHLKEGKVF